MKHSPAIESSNEMTPSAEELKQIFQQLKVEIPFDNITPLIDLYLRKKAIVSLDAIRLRAKNGYGGDCFDLTRLLMDAYLRNGVSEDQLQPVFTEIRQNVGGEFAHVALTRSNGEDLYYDDVSMLPYPLKIPEDGDSCDYKYSYYPNASNSCLISRSGQKISLEIRMFSGLVLNWDYDLDSQPIINDGEIEKACESYRKKTDTLFWLNYSSSQLGPQLESSFVHSTNEPLARIIHCMKINAQRLQIADVDQFIHEFRQIAQLVLKN